MAKVISFLLTTIVVAACAVCLYFCHQSGILLGDGADAFLYAVGMLALPFAASSIMGLIFDAEIEGENEYVALWKVSLGVCIAFVILGIMIVQSSPRIIPVDPKWVVTAQIGLPMLINYIMALWAIFRKKNNPNKMLYYSEEDYIKKAIKEQERRGGTYPSNTTSPNAPQCGPGGAPLEQGPNYIPGYSDRPYQ